jgi:hypothetical protein
VNGSLCDHVVRVRVEHFNVEPVDLRETSEYPENGILGVGHKLIREELRLVLSRLVLIPGMNGSRPPTNLQAASNSQQSQAIVSRFATEVQGKSSPETEPVSGTMKPAEKRFYRMPHNPTRVAPDIS